MATLETAMRFLLRRREKLAMYGSVYGRSV